MAPGAILVFFNGFDEIDRVRKTLLYNLDDGNIAK